MNRVIVGDPSKSVKSQLKKARKSGAKRIIIGHYNDERDEALYVEGLEDGTYNIKVVNFKDRSTSEAKLDNKEQLTRLVEEFNA